VERLQDAVNVINHSGYPLQLAVVAGKNEDLFAYLQHTEWHIPAHTYDFARNVPELMHAADLLVCKAGGLIVTEALACGLPMILSEITPGQEVGNAEFVVSNGAGDVAELPISQLETLTHLLRENGKLLKERAENARRIGLPRSAYHVAEILVAALQAEKKPASRRTFWKLLDDLSITEGIDDGKS
jgi:1,2-diacylglycerol 3-beta-galactosyltransferase